MYVYHLGAAQYLQKHVLPLLPADRVAFSGSSGGSLVACTLCTDIDVEAITRFVIACQPECQFNPWRMLPCADEAIATFLPEGAHDTCKARLRVLVTRIELAIGRSFVRPEAVSSFASREQLAQTLRASCHIPLLGGLLPYKVHKPDGTSSGAYYDGLFWPSILYMWRAFDASDTLLKVSGLGWPTAHVALPLPVPVHWLVLPPSQRTLWRLYASGYDDCARFFAQRDRGQQLLPRAARNASPSTAAPLLPPPSELPPPPERRDYALFASILIGWVHLFCLTLFFPLVPMYFALRNLTRPMSEMEMRRAFSLSDSAGASIGQPDGTSHRQPHSPPRTAGAAAAAAAAARSPVSSGSLAPASMAEAADGPVHGDGFGLAHWLRGGPQLLRNLLWRAAVVAFALALWPVAVVVIALRILLWPLKAPFGPSVSPLPFEASALSPLSRPTSPYSSVPGSPATRHADDQHESFRRPPSRSTSVSASSAASQPSSRRPTREEPLPAGLTHRPTREEPLPPDMVHVRSNWAATAGIIDYD